MNNKEFSERFDTLLNSYAHSAAPGIDYSQIDINLNEYEKSVFLTEAQEDVVLSLYNGKNSLGESFEQTEELRRYLAGLVLTSRLSPILNTNGTVLGINSNSKFFTLPDALWFIVYEAVNVTGKECESSEQIGVYPITHDGYHKIKKNPFRGVNDRRALRLDLADGVVEIICKYPIDEYFVRYLKKLSPIVLENMPDGLQVGGKSIKTECQVHESLHTKILERAVMLALRSKSIASQGNLEADRNNRV